MKISDMQERAWQNSEDKGFHNGLENLNVPTKLMLIVSEIAEALEEHRDPKVIDGRTFPIWFDGDNNGKPEGIAAELADAVIRIGDLAGIIGFDLEAAIIEKMKFNEGRPFMHGGKKF